MASGMTDRSDTPLYRQCNPHGFFADDDTLYPEGSTFYWLDTPNEFMEPLNEAARRKMSDYLDHLDDLAKKHAEKMGRPFYGRPRELSDAIGQAREDAITTRDGKEASATPGKKKIIATKRAPVSPQGHMAKRARPTSIQGAQMPPPDVPSSDKPINILGSRFEETLSHRG